jgi:chaperonin cofactor prefoldin
MDPLLMVGAWAAALLSVGALMRGIYTLFLRAVKAAIREELGRMRTDQDHIEQRLDALERAMEYLRRQVDGLTLMMQQHISREQ